MVVSGEAEAVEAIVEELAREGVESRWLRVSHAFHSPLMEPMLDEFERRVKEAGPRAPRLRLISNVSGELAGAEMAEPAYWRRHTREAVRFAAGIGKLNCDIGLEVGPGGVLAGMAQAAAGGGVWLHSLARGRGEWEKLLETAGALYVHGVELDWAAYDRPYARRKLALPSYAFQRERYWIEPRRRHTAEGKYLAGARAHSALPQAQFTAWLGERQPAYVGDHRIENNAMLPATVYLELALSAGREVYGERARGLRGVELREALLLEARETEVQTVVEPEESGAARFRIYSSTGTKEWRLHAEGEIGLEAGGERTEAETLEAARGRCREELAAETFYAGLRERGLQFGASFQGVERIWRGEREAVGQVRLPAEAGRAAAAGLHPVLLDACLQVTAAACPSGLYLPVRIEHFDVTAPSAGPCWSHARVRSLRRPAHADSGYNHLRRRRLAPRTSSRRNLPRGRHSTTGRQLDVRRRVAAGASARRRFAAGAGPLALDPRPFRRGPARCRPPQSKRLRVPAGRLRRGPGPGTRAAASRQLVRHHMRLAGRHSRAAGGSRSGDALGLRRHRCPGSSGVPLRAHRSRPRLRGGAASAVASRRNLRKPARHPQRSKRSYRGSCAERLPPRAQTVHASA